MAGLRSTNLQCLVQTKKAATVADAVTAVPWRSLEAKEGIDVAGKFRPRCGPEIQPGGEVPGVEFLMA